MALKESYLQAMKKEDAINGGEVIEREGDFGLNTTPSFEIAEIRAAIPKHCWVKNPRRSLSYVLRDIIVVFALAAAAVYFDSWVVWPLYWVLQGTMFRAIFVLGHDCGQGSFFESSLLNIVLGHILHSSILVPYHGWRISHRTHHQNHGNVGNDESFVPWTRSPGKEGSKFNPYSDLFAPNERKASLTSTVCWTIMLLLLLYSFFAVGPVKVLKLYGVPYLIFIMWLDFVTNLHHHGHEHKLPWYHGKGWSYLRGGLTTVDRDSEGSFNNIHHDIRTHVIDHLFSQIPPYHLVEATMAAGPVLGKYYREPKKFGPFLFHLCRNLVQSIRKEHSVSDTGDIVSVSEQETKSGESNSRRKLMPEFANHNYLSQHGRNQLIGDDQNSGKGVGRGQDHISMWGEICRLTGAQVVNSNWKHKSVGEFKQFEDIISDIVSQILEQLLQEVVDQLVWPDMKK